MKKMRKNKKILCVGLLLVSMLLSACGGKEAAKVNTTPQNTVEIQGDTVLKNALHNVKVSESERSFVVDRKTDYKIIVGDGEKSKEAADYLVKYLLKATGCSFSIADAKEYTADGKFIVLNVPELFKAAGLSMPEEDLGVMGYYIKTVGDNVFMASNTDKGARFAMLSFLRNVVGFEMYAQDTIVFTKDGTTMPDMEIIEKPDIDYVPANTTTRTPEASYMMGFMQDYFIGIGGEIWHNTLKYLPLETYEEAHPKWYSTYRNDLCYTARGDEKELQSMVQTIADIILEKSVGSQATFVTVSMMDHGQVCECDSCKATAAKYNGANSAAVVQFTNRIGDIVQTELQRRADAAGTEKQNLTILFFAYNALVKAPTIKNADGTFSPIDDSVVCRDGVAVYFAPARANFSRPFYDPKNAEFDEITQGWSACSKEVYTWLYETNFTNYLYPLNTWDSMLETYRYLVNNNSVYILPQGQWNATASTGFTDLKGYINSCACTDLTKSYNEILDGFFKNYYGAAEEPMRQYFDELQAWMRYLGEEYPSEVRGYLYEPINQSKFWPQNLLLKWLELIDEAYAAIEPCKAENEALYNTLRKHIKKESIFLRYALIEHHSGKLPAGELKQMKISFKADCEELGINRHQEGLFIKDVFGSWGL